MKKYKVTLTAEERQQLPGLIAAGKAAAKKLAHARILLKADAGRRRPGLDRRADRRGRRGQRRHRRAGPPAVRRGGAGGGPGPQEAGPSRSRERKLDGRAEARLIALACSPPPGRPGARGRCNCWPTGWSSWRSWTPSPTRRCAGRSKKRDQAVAEGAVVHPAGGRTPSSSARWRTCWRSTTGPTTRSGRWSAWTRRASNWSARSVQPLPAEPGQPERFDYEYVRNGTANLFMISEPLAGWRHVMVTERRTAKDFAEVLRWLAEDVYPEAEKVVLVMDNLNTHKLASPVRGVRAGAGPADRRAAGGPLHAQARAVG